MEMEKHWSNRAIRYESFRKKKNKEGEAQSNPDFFLASSALIKQQQKE
jgi:hypothetical protein